VKRSVLLSALGLFVGLSLGLALAYLSGESPLTVITVIAKSAFGSRYDLGVTLYYATALTFTGLSVAIAFHAGLFNIGAEGQLVMGTLAAVVVAALFPGLPVGLAPVVAVLAAIVGGGIWGWIPGWLRTRRGSHEVINTIMFNFIAAAISSWVITAKLQNPESQSPESAPVAEAYFLRTWDPFVRWFDDSPVSVAFPVAVLVAGLLWAFLWKTPWGFEIRASGENENASRTAGIDVARCRQLAMALAGALAGLVALNEVLGGVGKMRLGFSPDFGFIGIAVALLARNHPIGILFTAFLFGALHKGAADLDIETEYITRDLSLVIQALVILCVSVAVAYRAKGRR
jgi:general nucleoside transport system permease protein